jgi:peptidoglycan/xylan/chitin deacetylase (PgdA/CDA1 family)
LALTFDDGPDPRGTPAVLRALDQAEVKATFFVLGVQVEAHPDLLEWVLDAGHAVEVHGFEHVRHPFASREEVEQDLDRVLEVLARYSVVPSWWRIPWGHLADFTPQLAQGRGLTIVGWSADTHDWRGDSAEAMLEALPLEPGGIVLAHDGVGSGARRETARATADLVVPLVERARARGLTPTSLTRDWPVPIPVGNPEFHPGVCHAG